MDGLLIDSEVLWHRAEVEIFGALGVPLFESAIRSTKGVFVNEVVDYWYARYPWRGPSVDVVVDDAARTRRRVGRDGRSAVARGDSRARPHERARSGRARQFHAVGVDTTAASNTSASVDRFASIHSAEFEPYGKPHPGVFLTAASSLGVAPTRCLVFEDSTAGVIAARAASMRVVAVPDAARTATRSEFLLADLVLGLARGTSPTSGSTSSSPRGPS